VVAVLAGGTGGAKLARGLLDVVGGGALAVIANTADDIEVHGVHVSPDPDLVTYWLADLIDERGWGIAGDSWQVMADLEATGRPTWFRLGDRDLACCLVRTELMRGGLTQTRAHAELVKALGVEARVLPMSDDPVRTWIRTPAGERAFQEYMIVDGASAAIESVELRGLEDARPTADVLAALGEADAIVIGPSNPVVSIGPILALPGMRDALAAASAPVVAVSPWVGGRALKGPTDMFCAHAGITRGPRGVAQVYAGVIDAMVSDEGLDDSPVPLLETNTLMDTPAARRALAERTLDFAGSLGPRSG
jgi:LPPG:FO 2-phospho-L-lactate transferase